MATQTRSEAKSRFVDSFVRSFVRQNPGFNEPTNPTRVGDLLQNHLWSENGASLAELAALLGGGVLLLIALADVGRAALLRAQSAADEAAAGRATAEALVQIAQRDNITVNMMARTQALTPVLMWLTVLVVGLTALTVCALIIRKQRQHLAFWNESQPSVDVYRARPAFPEAGTQVMLRERRLYHVFVNSGEVHLANGDVARN
jgi:hypothetical protein